MGRTSLWKRLWQQIKRILRALLKVTEGPRSLFRFLYQQILHPLYEFGASTVVPPFALACNRFLPNVLNPFTTYERGSYDRALEMGNRTRYAFEKYVYTRYPEVFHGESYESQMEDNPDFKPPNAHILESTYLEKIDYEEKLQLSYEQLIREHFSKFSGIGNELIPEDFDEQVRQAIGAQSVTANLFQKALFWWADVLIHLEDVLSIPLGMFVEYMQTWDIFERMQLSWAVKDWRYKTWPTIRQLPLKLGESINHVAFNLITLPIGYVMYGLHYCIGQPLKVLSHLLWANWMTYVYFPFTEKIFDPIIVRKLYNPLFRQPWEDLIRWDPLIGQWSYSLINGLFAMTRAFVNDPIMAVFKLIHQIVMLPGDLLYLVYLFFIQLEDTMYFYFLYPLTDSAIKTHAFGEEFMDRLYNITMSFIHLVGYTRPTAIMAMSAIFTSLVVFFLNRVPL